MGGKVTGVKKVFQVRKLDGEVVNTFETVSKAARFTGVSTNTMLNRVNRIAFPAGEYYYCFDSDYDKHMRYEGKSRRPILLYSYWDDQWYYYLDCNELEKKQGLSDGYARSLIYKGEGVGKIGNEAFFFYQHSADDLQNIKVIRG